MNDCVVSLEGVSKTFRDFWMRPVTKAVDGISLKVPRGTVFGLLGPNGSGKSTTIKMILGLIRPTAGKVLLFGKPPQARDALKRLGYLPELSRLHPFLTARETLMYHGALAGLSGRLLRDRTASLLADTALAHVADRRVGTFSKGMARRTALAAALVASPELLVLDEPTSGLDPIGTRAVKELIRKLASQGVTILMTSHLLADSQDVCTHLAILANGHIAACGEKDELLQKTDTTRFSVRNLSPAAQEAVKSEMEALSGGEVVVDHPSASLEDFFAKTVEAAE
ncbi:MAG: ABC transporter ATP-binding protein [Kiritimatiellae bacterium]|nr:ABC transporter ATP-binding protein [Kiritimatiellia bacterium]